MERELIVVFDYEGLDDAPNLRECMTKEFVDLYNSYCAISNPLIAGWNKEFNERHPLHEIDMDNSSDIYMRFIIRKERQITRYMNKFMANKGLIEVDVDEDLNFVGRRRKNKNQTVRFHLEPL